MYKAWAAMVARCDHPTHTSYSSYGGRGITYDPRWKDFSAFLADMGERPAGMTLDRIDNDGPYCRENCRWATAEQQQNNRRCNRLVEYAGLTYTLAQWASITGFQFGTLRNRLDRGWSVERSLTEPVHLKGGGVRRSAVRPLTVDLKTS
jgi:hypothetical protein